MGAGEAKRPATTTADGSKASSHGSGRSEATRDHDSRREQGLKSWERAERSDPRPRQPTGARPQVMGAGEANRPATTTADGSKASSHGSGRSEATRDQDSRREQGLKSWERTERSDPRPRQPTERSDPRPRKMTML